SSVAPLPFAVKPSAPSTALVILIAPLPVEAVLFPAKVVVPATLNALFVVVYVPFKVTLSPYACAPEVVTFTSDVVPPAFVVREDIGRPARRGALNVVAPGEYAGSA